MVEITQRVTELRVGQTMAAGSLPAEEEQRLAAGIAHYVAERLKESGQTPSLITVKLDVHLSMLVTADPVDLFPDEKKASPK
jgi:hypothetical protein